MSEIKTLFWDVGGVLLSNAWDKNERAAVVARFPLNPDDFEELHHRVVNAFERGELTLAGYLEQTLPSMQESALRQEFKEAMFLQSQSRPGPLAIARQLAASDQCSMGTINNESTELNLLRIEKFQLRNIFELFVSSCFVGLQKPDPRIYAMALNITQRQPRECCFIDDRVENLVPARQLGMHTIHMEDADQLKADLRNLGISVAE